MSTRLRISCTNTALLLTGCLLATLPARAGQYFQDFQGLSVGATNMADGSRLFSTAPSNTAGVVDSSFKQLRLTMSGSNSTHSAFLLPALDTGVTVHAFSAKWNAVVYGNFGVSGADGFSLTFGQLAGLNLSSNAYVQETGFGTGITFSVRTYAGGSPGYFINVNGSQAAAAPFIPATNWGAFSNAFHFFEVDWHANLGMTVRMDGKTVFSNVLTTSFVPAAGDRLAFAARTGGESETIDIDNILVATRGLLYEVPMTAPYFSTQTNAGNEAVRAFDGNPFTTWAAATLPLATGIVGATTVERSGIMACTLTSAELGGGIATDPRSFALQGSTDYTNWSTVGTGTTYFLNRYETRSFLATNAASYSAFRLNAAVASGAIIGVAELKLYEFLSITNAAPFVKWPITGLPPMSFSDAAWADYDNDGDLDFAAVGRADGGLNYVGQLWKNQGNRAFVPDTASSLVGTENGCVVWGDYNNDGWVDLFIAGSQFISQYARIYKNDGHGVLNLAVNLPGMDTGEARWFDYDNDGDLDLIYGGQYNTGLYRNEGNDTFVLDTAESVPSAYSTGIEIGDVNLDGRLDYAIVAGGPISVHVNQGSGSFATNILYYGNNTETAFAWGDADADGDPDLAFAGRLSGGGATLYTETRNNDNGNLSFGFSMSGNPVVYNGDVAWADYEHDGDLDLLVAGEDFGFGRSSALLANNGGGALTALTNVQVGGFIQGTFAWGDFDNDHRPDYLVTGFSNFSGSALGVMEVRKNFMATPNVPPSAPSGLTITTNGWTVTLAWNAATDDVTPSNGLTYVIRVGTNAQGVQIVSPHANPTNGYRRIPALGHIGRQRKAIVQLPGPGTYTWSVQAIDNSLEGGPFAAEQTFAIPFTPEISVREPRAVSATQATIRCATWTKGTTGTVHFLWGTTPAYGNVTPPIPVYSRTNFVLVSSTLTGLVSGTTYYYRPVVSNFAATVTNGGMAFVATTSGTRIDFADQNDPLGAPSPNSPDVESPTQAVDNALSTKYLNFDGAGSGFDIRPSVTGTLRALTFASADDVFERDPTNFTLSGSSDGTNFVQFESGAIPPFADRLAIQSVTLTNPATYAWYRLIFTGVANTGYEMQIGELEFLPYGDILEPGVTSSLTISPDGISIIHPQDRLFDRFVNDDDDKFEATGFATSELVRVEVTLTNGLSILRGFELIGGTGDLANPDRRPGSVAVSGSNDGTNYTVLAVVIPSAVTNDRAIREYSTTNHGYAFSRYRIAFDAPTNGSYFEMGEVRLFGRRPTAIEAWRQQYFGSTANTGAGADGADADGDLHPNLFEYATGGNPNSSNAGSGIELLRTNNVQFLFDRNTSATDATIYVEGSTSMTNGVIWRGIATNRNGSWGGATNVTEGGGNPTAVFVTDPTPGTNRFLRLRITNP